MEEANDEEERRKLYDQMKATIVKTLNAIDNAYKDGKIGIEDYDEMTTGGCENHNHSFLRATRGGPHATIDNCCAPQRNTKGAV